MAKQLNVSLAFTANTNEAIAAIKLLQKELNGLATGNALKNSGISEITPEIQRAMVAAGELQAKLEAAVNLKTGKLDLSQFSDSLKKGGVSLQQYANQLSALGPVGRQAFINLAQSIMRAEAPLMRCSARLKELGTTLANTARWQLSSSILHGFMGTIQSAYGYAQDLNASLNDIRIVTGQNIEQMSRFAEQANKAAKALSTTTNEYAKASLIYYQQGDTDAEVAIKAAITTKMANVTGQSAEVVSNQLTSIWNNFNKEGDVAYEHFADVLTKLGAATASSTDEIAGGLEKFAGIATQIGLSYEYAASALATITATSRESEEVVGTALKTIFARIQGLNLGETLDDGTTLNKYSEALQKVGISIFDQYGEMKQMDDILEEMSDKWDDLSTAQQNALAQTVAGVRQYTQLTTLMNNWDFMDQNLATSFSANGELDKQADIYAESWEAARDRVRASAEAIYAKILDDEFFINFLDGLSKVIDGVGGLVDAFGGLKGILFTVGAFATKLFHDEMSQWFRNLAYNLKQLTPLGKQEQQTTREEALNALKRMKSNVTGAEGQAENAALQHEVDMQEALMVNAKRLTEEEIKQLQIQMDTVRALDKRAIATAKAADAAAEELEILRTTNKIQAQMDAKIKARTDAKSIGENAFVNKAFKASDTNGRKTMVEQYYKSQKKTAEDQVRQNHGLEAGSSLKGLEDEVKIAFIAGIRQAAKAEGASDIAKKVGAELENNISTAMSGAAKKMSTAMAKARKDVEDWDQYIDKIAQTSISAKSLGATSKEMSAFSGEGNEKAAKNAKELAALQETLKKKIIATRQAAEQLADTLGDEGMDIQLNDDIRELAAMEKQLNETALSADQLEDVINNLNKTSNSGDYAGMTISQRITDIADMTGAMAEVDAESNMEGANVNFSGHYAAAKKKAKADMESQNAGQDADNQKQNFDQKINDAGGVQDWADGIANATNIVMGLGSAITSVQGVIDVFNNPDATLWDRLSAVISVVIGLLPVLSTLFTTAGTAGTAAGVGMTAAMGPVGWIILAVIAAIAALTVAFSALSDAYNKDAIEAKKAAEAAKELAETAEEAKARVEKLKAAFDGYDNAIKTLKECTKGTQEWNDALAAVENEVLNIMQNFPELAKNADLFYRDLETGALMINEAERENLISEAERNAQVAQAASLVGAATASRAQVKSDTTDFKREGGSTGVGEAYTTSDGAVYYDYYIDLTDILADNAEQLANLTQEEYSEKVRELLKSTEAGINAYDDQIDSLVNQSIEYQAEVNNLAEKTHNAATQMENAANMIASVELGDKYGAAEQEMASEVYEAEVARLTDMYEKVLTSNSGDDIEGWDGPTGINKASGADNEVYEMALEKLQEAGYKYDKQKDNAVRGTDGNRSFAFLDENGEEVTRTAEWVAQTIATNEALKKLGEAAEKAQTSLQKFENNAGLEMGKAVKSLIANGNFDNLTEEDRDKIKEFSNADELEKYLIDSGMDKDTLYQSFGVENSDELFAKWQKAWDANRTALDSAGQFLTQAVEDAFNDLDTTTLTADQKRALSGYMNTALVESGDISTFTDAYNKVAKDQKDEFLKAFDGVDWTTVSVDEFREKLKQAGVTASFSNSELEKLIDSMGTAAEKSLDYAKVMKIIGDIKIGDTISAEEYSKLGDGYEEYFRLMADGTYQLTNDAEEFYNLVKENALQQFINKINDASNSNKNINNVVGKFNTDYSRGALTKNTYHIGYGSNYSDAFDKDAAQNQLEFLTATGAIDSTTLSTWQAVINDRNSGIDVALDETLKSTLEEMNAAVAQNQHFWEDWQNTIDANNKIVEQNIIQYLSSAENLNEFDELLLKLKDETGLNSISTEIYSQALKMLGSQYENCSQEIKAYEEALSSGTIKEIEDAEAKLKSAIATGELAKQYGLNAELLETQAGLYKDYYTNLELSEEAAIRLSVQNLRMNEGVKTLSDKWKDYANILNISDGKIGDVDKTSSDYAQTLTDLKDIVIELTGANKDLAISNEFIEDNIDKIEGAAKGEAKAIQQLGTALAQFQIDSLDATTSNLQEAFGSTKTVVRQIRTDIQAINIDGAIDPTPVFRNVKVQALKTEKELQKEFNNARDAVKDGMQIIQDAIDSGAIEIGADLSALTELPDFDFNDWITQINKVATAAAMSKEELLSMFETMGMDVDPQHIHIKEVELTESVPQYESVFEQKDGKWTMTTSQTGYTTMKTKKQIATLDQEAKIEYSGSGNISSSSLPSSKSKSGSQKPDKMDKDRYKQLNDSLETVSDAMSDAEKAADRLYGRSRLKQMEKVNDELLKEIELQKKKRKEAEEYLKTVDKPALEVAFKTLSSEFGLGEEIQLQFNTDGSIKNIETIMDMVIAAYNAKAEELKDSMNEADQALLENMKATIEAFKDAIGQYDDTRSIIREAENARQDAFNKWQDNNYEQLSYSLEIDLEINEAKLQDLEYRINRLGDTAAEMAEAIGLIYSNSGTGNQYSTYLNSLREYSDYKTTLDSSFAAGRISQADYVEGLREVSDGIYENLEALNDLDKTMMEYYGNTLAAANEELDKFIERMSHSAGILEHYSSIMDLLGKSSDYKTMGVILEGQADVAENQAKSSKAIMEMMQGEAEDRYRAYQGALASGDKAAAELYLKQYEEALAAAQEAEDEYLSNAEQWAESLKAILENKLADLGKTLEEALTGGTSFEQLTTQMERAASLQEEYLTSTNQIYETTKMMRAAQQEIDKTTNTVAKNKIANFIAETKQLQNQSKLSKYELDVQQAKYDLLLAEIALQEAQNAKSTVRLQRDAEGNFGYVYTADSSAIADATQKYEDAQNALYNIGLEGANDYGQKYQQTMNEMYDSLTELQNQYLSGAFESESAYNLAVEEAKRYYYAKLEQYSSLYATATTADSRVVAEAWFNDFSEMMTTSETWKLAVEEHVANVSIAFGEWQTQVEEIASDAGIGGDLESLKLKVNGIVLETSSLTTELTKQGGTIDSLQGSLATVKENTDAYAELRKQLEATAERYRQLAKDASAAAAAQNIIDNSVGEVEDLSIQADEYAKKLEETLAELYEKLKEVKEKRLNEEITQEEYEAQVEAIKKDYYEKLEQYSKEYREILAKDNDLVAEDWFLTLEEMIKDEETFNQAVQEKLKEIEDYFKTLAEKITESGGEMEEEFKELTSDINEAEKATGLLNKGIKGPNGLIEAFRGQMVQIDESINAYDSLYSRLEYAAEAYRELAAAAREAARAQSSVSGGGGGSSYSGINMSSLSSEFSYAHFDTGGYTGQWGSYGKLAMLHEKELVLNKQDTENFLASMGILNNILQTIDLQSANAQIGGILTTPSFHGGGNDMLEQNVHIEASFPNVQNSNDIEEAFNNLINRASQYANRK